MGVCGEGKKRNVTPAQKHACCGVFVNTERPLVDSGGKRGEPKVTSYFDAYA